MGKLFKGDNIKNSSLFVIDYVSDSRVRCGCTKCNQGVSDTYVSMIYNESDLLKGGVKCRFCNEVNKAKEDVIYSERQIYLDMLASSSKANTITAKLNTRFVVTDEDELNISSFSTKYPLNKKYGELISIAYMTVLKKKDEYGLHYTIPTHLVLKCETCGYIKFVSIKDINSINHVCPLCYKLRNKMIKRNKEREDAINKKDIEKSQSRDFGTVKTEFSKLASNKLMQKSVSTLESKNSGYKVIDITKDGGATTYHLVCEKCGSITTCMRSNAKVGECQFCKSKEENKDYSKVGYLYKDYIGTIFNGLKVISQNGLECEVECIKCGKKRIVNTYGVLSKRYYCDCEASKISMECPYCFAPLPSVSYKDIYSGKSIKCPSCNEIIDDSEFLIAIEGMDYSNSLRSKLAIANNGISDKAVKKIKFGNKFAVDTLIVEKDSVYKGNDEKSYFRCFCKEHNIGLLLSEDEIQSYECQYCDDSRQKIIANPDSSSIKLE